MSVKNILFILITFGLCLSSSSLWALGSQGQEFWLAFPYANTYGNPQTISLLLSSNVNTTATVLDPTVGVPATYPIVVGATTTVPIQIATQMAATSDNTVTHLGIHVTAPNDFTIYGINYIQYATDGYLGLPVVSLDTDYIVMAYTPNVGAGADSQFTIVATASGTNVTITPSVTADGETAGVPFVITLPNPGDTYELGTSSGDLTGTLIHATQPIAVFSGVGCADVPTGYMSCNELLEQLWPTASWGSSFVTMPLATRTKGDTFRFLASTNSTTVNINGVPLAPLNQGQFNEQVITAPSYITANQPIYVAQYSNSSNYDGVTDADPYMISVPPTSQFQNSYTIGIPAAAYGYSPNYENILVPTAAVGTILLDGVAIPAGSFAPIGASGYSGAQVSVTNATHLVKGPVAFGDIVYGYGSADGYGYPAGVLVANGTITPTPTNTGTLVPTNTPTNTTTSTFTPTPSNTPTSSKTNTPTNTNTATNTPTITPTFTPTPSATPTCVTYVWPDPYNPRTAVGGTLRFSCMDGMTVSIFTVSGELIQTITGNSPGQPCGGNVLPAWGSYYCWNGRNAVGWPVSTGIYFYVVQRGTQVMQRGKFLMVDGS